MRSRHDSHDAKLSLGLVALIVGAACGGGVGRTDVGGPVDAVGGDVVAEDARALLDAAVDDAMDSGIDGAPTDRPTTGEGGTDARGDVTTDTGPRCVCPPLPTTCTPLTANDTAFTPTDDSMLRQLFGAIACADTYVHAAIYEATWSCVVDAILARLTAAPMLQVHLVIDDDQCPRVAGALTCELSRLDAHPRVTIVDDARSALMHDKFILVDGEMVWVASSNMVRQSFCVDANNSIVLTDTGIVGAYEAEFQRMFTMRMFGPRPDEAPFVSGPYTAYFGPRSPVADPARWFTDMIAAIGRATTTIEFAISAFTRVEIADALIAARIRGVDVRGVVSSLYAMDIPTMRLVAAGVPVRVGEIHNKMMVIDSRIVITGSANWSTNAFGNTENVLWIDDATVAGRYRAETLRLFARGRLP